jgi:hypothetical protein
MGNLDLQAASTVISDHVFRVCLLKIPIPVRLFDNKLKIPESSFLILFQRCFLSNSMKINQNLKIKLPETLLQKFVRNLKYVAFLLDLESSCFLKCPE